MGEVVEVYAVIVEQTFDIICISKQTFLHLSSPLAYNITIIGFYKKASFYLSNFHIFKCTSMSIISLCISLTHVRFNEVVTILNNFPQLSKY